MKFVLIALNLLAALLVFPAMHIAHDFYKFRAVDMYVALDRAEIINKEKLKEAYPDKIQNDRILVPAFFMDRTHYINLVGIPCVIGFGLNVILISFFWKRNTAEQDAAANP